MRNHPRAATYAKKRLVLERLLAAWEALPEYRLGQLLFCALDEIGTGDPGNVLFDIEDLGLVRDVEAFVDKHEPKPGPYVVLGKSANEEAGVEPLPSSEDEEISTVHCESCGKVRAYHPAKGLPGWCFDDKDATWYCNAEDCALAFVQKPLETEE